MSDSVIRSCFSAWLGFLAVAAPAASTLPSSSAIHPQNTKTPISTTSLWRAIRFYEAIRPSPRCSPPRSSSAQDSTPSSIAASTCSFPPPQSLFSPTPLLCVVCQGWHGFPSISHEGGLIEGSFFAAGSPAVVSNEMPLSASLSVREARP